MSSTCFCTYLRILLPTYTRIEVGPLLMEECMAVDYRVVGRSGNPIFVTASCSCAAVTFQSASLSSPRGSLQVSVCGGTAEQSLR